MDSSGTIERKADDDALETRKACRQSMFENNSLNKISSLPQILREMNDDTTRRHQEKMEKQINCLTS